MSASRSFNTVTTQNSPARVLTVYLSKPRESKYEALTPSTDSPATRRAWHGRPTWGTRGARAASLRVTLTLYPRAAPVGSGGRAKLWISAQNVLQTFKRNSQTRIVPQRPLPAPAAVKRTSSVMKRTAASVSPWCRCLMHQKTLCLERREWPLYLFRTGHPAQTQSWVRYPLPRNVHLTQPQSQKVMFHLRSEQEWVRSQMVRSPRHRYHLCPHHRRHPRLAVALNSGAANVAIAAKPNWSWYSKSWVPVAVVMSSACSTDFQSSTSVCLTTWVVGVRRPSSRWWSSTARWAAHASASGRSALEQPFPLRWISVFRRCVSTNRDMIFFFFSPCFFRIFAGFLDTNLHSFVFFVVFF